METEIDTRLQFREKLKMLSEEYMQTTHEPDIVDFYGDVISETLRAIYLGSDDCHKHETVRMIYSMINRSMEELVK